MMAGSGRLSAAERRTSLLASAEVVFLDRGYHHTTNRNEIARLTGMSKKTIYRLFPGKASLLKALLSDRIQILPVAVENDGWAPRTVLIDVLCRAPGLL